MELSYLSCISDQVLAFLCKPSMVCTEWGCYNCSYHPLLLYCYINISRIGLPTSWVTSFDGGLCFGVQRPANCTWSPLDEGFEVTCLAKWLRVRGRGLGASRHGPAGQPRVRIVVGGNHAIIQLEPCDWLNSCAVLLW